MELQINGLVKSGMGTRNAPEPREIFLGEWLELFGIGVTEAAGIAGCDQSYISNIIAGRKPNINTLYLLRLSEHMEININDFFRPLPSQSQIASLKRLSPRAQAAVLAQKRKKA